MIRPPLLSAPLVFALQGCLYLPGPSLAYPARSEAVEHEWGRMLAEPAGLPRPLLVIDGWLPHGARIVGHELQRLTGAPDEQILIYSYGIGANVPSLARRVIHKVESRWPSADSEWTAEVDVVGFSLGGIIARTAALPALAEEGAGRKRLRIRRLYTISTPHRGTVGIARVLPIDSSARAVLPGSATLCRLDAALGDAEYELHCYGQLNDWIVGARNTAPPDRQPIWTDGPLVMSHLLSSTNRRILADIALRLRGEPPLAGSPSPPPRD